jgi:preprotein translocase subunit SecF
MNISETFIRRPIATSLLMAAIGMFGVISYNALPVSDLPQVDSPTLTVFAGLPGGNPDTMASAVATPLERQFTTIAGLDSMTSNSRQNSTSITLTFDLNREIDGATVDVQTAIAAAMPLLPPGMPTPPSFRKSNPGDAPIISIFVTSPTMRLSDLNEYAETMVGQRISMIEGVAQVQVFGSTKYAVRVQVNPNILAARGIGLNEVDAALRDWNVNLPAGTLYGPSRTFNITSNGQLMKAEDYKDLIITYKNGAPVRLSEVATILDSVEDDKNFSRIFGGEYGAEGTRGVSLAVMRQPGSNTIEVTDKIKQVLPELQANMPPSVVLNIRGDRSKNIREAFQDIQFTMIATLALVIMVIFLFLRSLRATMIPAMALPFSIVGTFSVMYLLGFSLNNISMMALILSIGFVVDDAIVMLENTVRHIERGETPMVAALTGSREVGFTIVSMTLSLAAVFIPILFMSGILGRLFREFAVTICTAILISGMVSISLTPMLCSRFLKEMKPEKHGFMYRGLEKVFDWNLNIYAVTLRWVLNHRPVMLVMFVAVMGTTVYLYNVVPKGFIPDTDSDNFSVQVEAAQGTSYFQMVKYQDLVSSIVVKDPDVEGVLLDDGRHGGIRRILEQRTPDGEYQTASRARCQRAGYREPSAAQGFEYPRAAGVSLGAAGHSRGRSHVEERLRFHAVRSGHHRALRPSAGVREGDGADSRPAGRVERPADQDPAYQHRARPRSRRGIEPQLGGDFEHPVRRLRTAPGVHDLCADQPVPRDARDAAGVSEAHRRARYDLPQVGHRTTGAAEGRRQFEAGGGTGEHSTFGPVAVGIDVVRTAAGDIARPGHRRDHGGGQDQFAGYYHRNFHRHRESLSGFAQKHGRAADYRDPGGVHRARRVVRKLYPPPDDSLRAALRRIRCAADAVDLQGRAQHLRFRGPDHADRHREEERHHADRFRARSGASRRQVSQGCDL